MGEPIAKLRTRKSRDPDPDRASGRVPSRGGQASIFILLRRMEGHALDTYEITLEKAVENRFFT